MPKCHIPNLQAKLVPTCTVAPSAVHVLSLSCLFNAVQANQNNLRVAEQQKVEKKEYMYHKIVKYTTPLHTLEPFHNCIMKTDM